jgi:hypothetical protein
LNLVINRHESNVEVAWGSTVGADVKLVNIRPAISRQWCRDPRNDVEIRDAIYPPGEEEPFAGASSISTGSSTISPNCLFADWHPRNRDEMQPVFLQFIFPVGYQHRHRVEGVWPRLAAALEDRRRPDSRVSRCEAPTLVEAGSVESDLVGADLEPAPLRLPRDRLVAAIAIVAIPSIVALTLDFERIHFVVRDAG